MFLILFNSCGNVGYKLYVGSIRVDVCGFWVVVGIAGFSCCGFWVVVGIAGFSWDDVGED